MRSWIGVLLVMTGAGCATQKPTLDTTPPDDAIVLFGGDEWTGWQQRDGGPSVWQVQEDGSVLVHGGDAITEATFDDFQLHLEFRCPPSPAAEGQARGNSGVYLHGRYEVQVLASHGDPPRMNGCGAVYGIAPPMVNASQPAGEWETYDIVFRAPRLDGRRCRDRAAAADGGAQRRRDSQQPRPAAGDGGRDRRHHAGFRPAPAPGSRRRGPIPQHLGASLEDQSPE